MGGQGEAVLWGQGAIVEVFPVWRSGADAGTRYLWWCSQRSVAAGRWSSSPGEWADRCRRSDPGWRWCGASTPPATWACSRISGCCPADHLHARMNHKQHQFTDIFILWRLRCSLSAPDLFCLFHICLNFGFEPTKSQQQVSYLLSGLSSSPALSLNYCWPWMCVESTQTHTHTHTHTPCSLQPALFPLIMLLWPQPGSFLSKWLVYLLPRHSGLVTQALSSPLDLFISFFPLSFSIAAANSVSYTRLFSLSSDSSGDYSAFLPFKNHNKRKEGSTSLNTSLWTPISITVQCVSNWVIGNKSHITFCWFSPHAFWSSSVKLCADTCVKLFLVCIPMQFTKWVTNRLDHIEWLSDNITRIKS